MIRILFAILVSFFFFSSCGDDGKPGAIGPAGPQGLTGAQGDKGEQGDPGTPGTVITPIQFCPASFVPVYPSVFPELGFKIGNKIYAVYSDHGGFLVVLTPGTYSSNGINASCTFSVDSDGNVSW